MPCASVTLTDVEQSVARPIIFTILNQIFEITQLSKDTAIHYAGKRTMMSSPGTSIDDGDERDAQFATKRTTAIEVTEQYDVAAVQEVQPNSYDHEAVFDDPYVQLSLRPIYLPSNVTISIRYRSNSETEVKRWMAEMLTRTARGRDINLHDVDYTYALPDAFTGLLLDVWTLRNAVSPCGDTPEDYVTRYGSNRLTLLTNRGGEHGILAISERQTQIQGFFDFVGIPDAPIRDQASGSWEIAFDYKFNYQRPDGISAHYPISVHNQLLPEKYIATLGDQDDFSKAVYRSKSYDALHMFDLNTIAMLSRKPYPYLRLPDYDDFQPVATAQGTATILTALCFLDEGGTALMSLMDLGDYILDPILLPYFKAEAGYMTKLFHSLVHVSLYRNGDLVPDGAIVVDSDLSIRALKPLDPRYVYHVRVAAMVEINMSLQAAIDRLAKYPGAFVSFIGILNELLQVNPGFKGLAGKNRIDEWEMKAVFRILAGASRANNYGPVTQLPHTPGDNIDGWGWSNGSEFLKDVDQATISEYFRLKRQVQPTVMVAGIITRAIPAA